MEGRSGVHRESEGYYASIVWCVSQENFVQIAKLLANGRSTGVLVQTGFRPAVGQQYSVKAVLASSDSRTPLAAQSLEIEAQTADKVGNVQAWRTLNAGDNQCSNCASVGILSVPDGTKRTKTHIEVKSGTVDGLLYLASVGTWEPWVKWKRFWWLLRASCRISNQPAHFRSSRHSLIVNFLT